jgi:hypothetical protein
MLDRVSIAARVGFAIIWMGLCLLWSASVTGDYWLLGLGLFGAFAALCVGHVGRFAMWVTDTMRALFAEPSTPEYERSVDGVRQAALNIHNWASRNIAAAIGCGTIIALWLAPEPLEFPIGLIGIIAIPVSTHWPAIARRFREWGTKLEAAE